MKPPSIAPTPRLLDRCGEIARQEEELRQGGGPAGQERQHKLGRLFVRERIAGRKDVSNSIMLKLAADPDSDVVERVVIAAAVGYPDAEDRACSVLAERNRSGQYKWDDIAKLFCQ